MKNQEISVLIGQKRAYNSSSFLLRSSKNGALKDQDSIKKPNNIAILASKKNFKTAVLRNKVRRRIRGAIQKVILDRGGEGVPLRKKINEYNLIFSLKKGVDSVLFSSLVAEIEQSLLKNGII